MCILAYFDGTEGQEWLDQEDVIIDELNHHPPTATVEVGGLVIASTLREPIWHRLK